MGLIVTITGVSGAGNSSAARLLAKKLNVQSFSMGDLRKQAAVNKGMTMEEFNRYSETDLSSDKEVDAIRSHLPEKYDSFVLDTKLGKLFLKQAIGVYLTVDKRVAGERILGQKREAQPFTTVEEAMASVEERERTDKVRYKQLYDYNPFLPEQYDLVIDTTTLTVEETVAKILEYLEKHGKLKEQHL